MKKENLHPEQPVRRSGPNGRDRLHVRAGTSSHPRTTEQRVYSAAPDGRPVRRVPVNARPVRRRKIPPLRLVVYIGVPLLVVLLLLLLLWPKNDAGNMEEAVSAALEVSSQVSVESVESGAVSSEEVLAGAEEISYDPEDVRSMLLAKPDHNTEALLLLLDGDEEAIAFAAQYPEKNGTQLDFTLTEDDLQMEENRLLPLFMQWDERWGYTDYSGYLFGTNACGPTTLSMVAVALTGDTSLNPRVVADFAEENGYAYGGQGTEWTLMSDGCAAFGLEAEELYPMENMVRNAIEEGRPVVCIMGPGHFTTGGHYVVICGTDGDRFLINDCNSYSRSAQSWAFEDFVDEIDCLWEFSYTE